MIYFVGVYDPRDYAGHVCLLNGRRTGPADPLSPWAYGTLPLAELVPLCRSSSLGQIDRVQPEGELYTEQSGSGWTLVAAWDRSGDSRFNSSVVWAAKVETFAETFALIRRYYGDVVARMEARVSAGPIETWPRTALTDAYPRSELSVRLRPICPHCGGSGVTR